MRIVPFILPLLFSFACVGDREEQKELEYERVGPVTDEVELHTGEDGEEDVEREELPDTISD